MYADESEELNIINSMVKQENDFEIKAEADMGGEFNHETIGMDVFQKNSPEMIPDVSQIPKMIDTEEGLRPVLVRKTGNRTRSVIWDYFGLKINHANEFIEKKRPVCTICYKSVLAADGNTSNLFHHLRDHHRTLYDEVKRGQVASNVAVIYVGKEKNTEPRGKAQKSFESKYIATAPKPILPKFSTPDNYIWAQGPPSSIKRALGYFISKDMLPFETIEKPGFKKFIQTIDSAFILPEKAGLEFEVNEIYHSLKNSSHFITKTGANNSRYAGIFLEIWIHKPSLTSYLTMTLQKINQNWKFERSYIRTLEIRRDVNLCEMIKETLRSLNIEAAFIATINDDCLAEVCKQLNWPYITCFSVNTRKCMEEGLKFDPLNDALKWLISVYDKVANMTISLEELKMDLSQLKMDQLEIMMLNTEKYIQEKILLGTSYFYDIIKAFLNISKIFKTIGEVFAAEDYVSVAAFSPVLYHILGNKLKADDQDTEEVVNLKTIIHDNLHFNYTENDIQNLLEISSFLDPRFRDQHLENRDNTFKLIKTEFSKVVKREENESNTLLDNEEPAEKKPKQEKGLGALLSSISTMKETSGSNDDKIDKEINNYIYHPVACESSDDPLTWWAAQVNQFPTLSTVAKKYLCLSAISISPKRLLSGNNQAFIEKRNALETAYIDKMLFLAENLP